MTAKLVWIDAITQRTAIRWRTSRSASWRDSAVKRSARSSPRPIVLPSRMPETESDSCTMLEMSASDSCVDLAIRRRSFPTRRVRRAKSGISANANSASSQLSKSMPTIVATTVVTLDAIDVAVLVTTFCTPPMSFEMRDCTSPVRVRVKNASDRRCRWRKTFARRSCMTRWPTWLERSVCTTPRTPLTTAITIIPPAAQESAVLSSCAIASITRFSRKAGMTPSRAPTTISASRPESRGRYGLKSPTMRRKLARRTSGSAGRSGASRAEWKYIPMRPGYVVVTSLRPASSENWYRRKEQRDEGLRGRSNGRDRPAVGAAARLERARGGRDDPDAGKVRAAPLARRGRRADERARSRGGAGRGRERETRRDRPPDDGAGGVARPEAFRPHVRRDEPAANRRDPQPARRGRRFGRRAFRRPELHGLEQRRACPKPARDARGDQRAGVARRRHGSSAPLRQPLRPRRLR